MIRAAVLGSPISHSLSPKLHLSAYKKLGIEAEYSAIEIKENELSTFIANLDGNWSGFSLTMPLKEVALEVATSADAIARTISSANTLLPRGRDWFATSTDRTGFISLLASHKFSSARSIAIFGAGGTARAAISACDYDGAAITVFRRSPTRDTSLRKCATNAQLFIKEWESTDLGRFDLVINTVPGPAPAELCQSLSKLPPLIDVIYNPWPSPLAQIWVAHQPKVISGVELLIWQGIDQIELMSGETFNREEMFDHLFHTLVTLT